MCILAGWKDRQREAGWFVCNITRRPSSPLCAMWTFQIYITENTTIEVQILKNNSLKREINGVDFLFLISFLIFAQRTTPRAKRWVFKTQLMSLAQPVQWVFQGFILFKKSGSADDSLACFVYMAWMLVFRPTLYLTSVRMTRQACLRLLLTQLLDLKLRINWLKCSYPAEEQQESSH